MAAAEEGCALSTYAVIGGTVWGNRGAEAMVATTIGRVRDREADATFLLMSYFPAADRRLVDDARIRVVDARPRAVALVHLPFALLCWLLARVGIRLADAVLPRSVRSLRDCRALFDVSGISFNDGRLAVVAYNVLCVVPAMLLGVPVVRLSQAMGPFRHPLNRHPARWVTRWALHSFARGRHTAEHLQGLDAPDASWSVAADLAFAYRPADSLTRENEDRVAALEDHLDGVRTRGERIAAVVPSSLVLGRSRAEGDDYVALLTSAVAELTRRGFHVLVVPNATRDGVHELRNNDLVAVGALRERLAATADVDRTSVSYVDHDLNTAAIRSLLARTELVITSRFHAMVAALALGIPPLVIGWSHKYEEVLEMFGVADDAVDHADAAGELLAMLDRALGRLDETRELIRDRLPQVTASARAQFDVVDRLPADRR